MEKRIIWTRTALNHLNQINEYIFNVSKSQQIADKVTQQVFNSAKILLKNCEIFPLDVYKTKNDGNFRAYEIFHYRISYKISGEEILILRVRHTSRNPLQH